MFRSGHGRILARGILLFWMTGCSQGNGGDGGAGQSPPTDVWDVDAQGVPRFVDVDYVELAKVARISRFRSSVGHDYSDATEHCRSMKHYFEPAMSTDWAMVAIRAPVSGRLTRVDQEWAGTKYEIEAESQPAFRFSIFHVNPAVPRNVHDHINAGDVLGMHIGSQTMSDISVMVNDPSRQGRLVSYFDVVTDAVFQGYVTRGVASREQMKITRAERDAHPLSCAGDTFSSSDPLEGWVVLN